MFKIIAIATTILGVFLVIHPTAFRLIEIKNRTRTLTRFMLLCTLLVLPLLTQFEGQLVLSENLEQICFVIYIFLLYTLLWFGYLQFYFSFERSPSLRFLVHIEENPQGLTPKELSKLFSFVDDVMGRRVSQMVNVRLIIQREKDGKIRYFNSAKGQFIGSFNLFVKKFLRLGRGG